MIAFTAAVAIASTNFKTGNDLYEKCLQESIVCVDYPMGVIDGVQALVDGGIVKPLFCVPVGATGRQIEDVVRNYLAANPETRTSSAGRLTVLALHKAFPCPKS